VILRRLVQSFYRQLPCGGTTFNRYQTFKWRQTSWALPLILRKEKLTLQYITKLKSTSDNVPYTFVFELNCALFFEAKNSLIPTLRVWMKDLLLDTRIQFKCVDKSHLSLITCFSLAYQKTSRIHLSDICTKSDVPPDVFKSKLIEITSGLWWFPRNLYRWVESWRCNSTAAAVPNVYQSSHLSSQRKFVAFYFRWSSWSSLLAMNSSYYHTLFLAFRESRTRSTSNSENCRNSASTRWL